MARNWSLGTMHCPAETDTMTLQDHFRPPLGVRRHWHAFHNSWATYISADLNRRLPEGYFAEANVQFGIEIDVAAFEESGAQIGSSEHGPAWKPPAPTLTSVILSPVTVSLISGTTRQFKAYGRNSAGDSVAVSVAPTSPRFGRI